MKIIDVHFDRFAVVGNLYHEAESDLQYFLDRTDSTIKSKGASRVVAQLMGDNVYLEYDLQKGKDFHKGNFRIDYNPSKLSTESHSDLIQTLKPMLHDLHYTRIDLAFDCDFNLSEYAHEHTNPSKWAKFGGATGAIETLYYGSRSSDYYSRTYNKKLQLEDDGGLNIDDYEHYWRYELEIKNRKACEDMIAMDFPIFERVRFKKRGYEGLTGIERVVAQSLIEHPENEGFLTQYQRSKYRKIIKQLDADDVTGIFENELKNKLPQLKRELRAWQPIPKFTDIINRRWY